MNRRRVPNRFKPPIRSLVIYCWEAPISDRHKTPNEYAIDDLLKKAQVERLVRSYDTGRGLVVWFEGAAGKKLRDLRDRVRAMLPPEWVAVR